MNQFFPQGKYRHYCFVLLAFLFHVTSYGQAEQTVSGIVRDSTGQPLSGVTLQVNGSTRSTLSDSIGRYTLLVPATAVLTVSYVGYLTQQVRINGRSILNLTLQPDVASNQGDVVVVGYGRQKAITVTGAVSQVSGKNLVATPLSSITSMLVGQAPGISATQASGEPGNNAATIRIRGIATLNGSDPLIVIDGIQQPTEQPYVVLNAIDANEIESVSVLKDAASTAVFGIRGANGVIVVTTKRGRADAPVLSFSANSGFTKRIASLQTLSSYDYALMRNMAIRSEQSFGNRTFDNFLFSDDELWKFQYNRDYTPAEVNAMNLTGTQKASLLESPALYYTNNNWFDKQFNRVAPQAQYNLNASGGTDKVRYFTSLGYFSQGGIISNTSYGGSNTNSSYERYNFRSNFDINVIKYTTLSVNLAGQSSLQAGAITASNQTDLGNRYKALSQSILEGNPFSGPGIVDGKLVTGFINVGNFGVKGGSGTSPISTLLTNPVLTQRTTTLTANLVLRHNFSYLTKGLSAHASLSYDNSYTKGIKVKPTVPTYSVFRNPANPNDLVFSGGALNTTVVNDNFGNYNWRKIYTEAGLDYSRTFGAHAIGGLLLANAQKYTMPSDIFNTSSGLMGFVARTTYNYRQRYLLEFNMAYNGTEQFAEGNRFGFFPAVSGGWVASNESFFPKSKTFTYLKFRGSFGEVGNDQVNGRRYIYLPNTWTYSGSVNPTQGYWFGNANGSSNPYYYGATEASVGNPAITWERAKKYNVALESRFLNDRLLLNVDLFKENRTRILINLGTIPAVYGVDPSVVPPANLGNMTNKGYEVQLGWTDRIGGFRYSLRSNVSYAVNKIEYKDEPAYPYYWMNQTGFALGQYKGLISDGFYNTAEELNNRVYNTYDNNVHLGDIRYKDINGDGKIDDKDYVPIGYSNLPRFAYNFNLSISYKGFDLSGLFIGTAQGSFPIQGVLQSPFFKVNGNALQYMYDGMWTAEKAASGARITYPRPSVNQSSSNNNYLFSNFWLVSNNFQRLKNLEVGYTFQQLALLRKARINSLRLYANANNVFTWGSKLPKGVDPELQDIGSNSSGYLYPITRIVNFGLNLQF